MNVLADCRLVINNIIFFIITLNECSLQLLQSYKQGEKTLVCGSSHAGCFVRENAPNIHTLIFPSQDLESTYSVLKFYKAQHGIQKFVLFFSVFSPGFSLKKSRVFGRGIGLKMGLYFARHPYILKMLLLVSNPIVKCIRFGKSFQGKEVSSLEKVCSQHLYYNKKWDSIQFLFDIVRFCEENNIMLFLVKSPASSDYIKICEQVSNPFELVTQLSERKPYIRVIDLWAKYAHMEQDWIDFDHLNAKSISSEHITTTIVQMTKVL